MNLIPFGKDKSTGKLVDVSDVTRGSECGCICPACGIPLIARQGTQKEWHFAHTKEHQQRKTGVCKYSWFVALRMMIRQILSEEKEIFLPEYTKYYPQTRQKINITQSHRLSYDKCVTDVLEKEEHHQFDAKLMFREHPLHIFVSYKGRKYHGYYPEHKMEGILEIDLMQLRLTRQKQLTDKSCIAQLRYMLKTPHHCKKWLYHKRERTIEAKIREVKADKKKQRAIERAKRKRQQDVQLAAKPQHKTAPVLTKPAAAKPPKVVESAVKTPTVKVPKVSKPVIEAKPKQKAEVVKDKPYYCIMCQHEYMGTEEGLNPCPKCNEHLYRREA